MRLQALVLLLPALYPGATSLRRPRGCLCFQALPPRMPALQHPRPQRGCARDATPAAAPRMPALRRPSPAMRLRGEGSDAALQAPTVVFEGDVTMPEALFSAGWFGQAAGILGNGAAWGGQAADFDSLCLKLDGVLLFEAQREKASLDACLRALESGQGASVEGARTFTEHVRRACQQPAPCAAQRPHSRAHIRASM
jgi:hypothetical protein